MPVYSPEEFLDLLDQNGDPTNLAVPFLDLKAQQHQIYNEIDDRITDVIANTAFIMGKHVREFEEQFAELQEAKYCIGVSSGTDALHVALLALGIGPGDKVIVPVNTFIATAEAVSLCGAEPVFVDCDEYYNLDVKELRKVIESRQVEKNVSRKGAKAQKGESTEDCLKIEDEKIRRLEDEKNAGMIKTEDRGLEGPITNNKSPITCILPVHLYGQPANMDEIMALADEYGLKVVEDCAQAHLAAWRTEHGAWRKVGNWGEFGAFSFYPGKNLGAYGEAGAVVTNNADLYEKIKLIHDHGSAVRYHHDVVGHNYRMEAIQGAVLSTKLKYLEEWTEKRRENAYLYNELLSDVEGIKTPREIEDIYAVYHLYVIQVDDRDGLQRYLQENGISTGLHYPVPLHTQRAYAGLGYKEEDFPVAGAAAKRILSLPMYPELAEGQIRYVCEKIKQYY
jgi:dTDP-4-amino-4,6-dideoxygalactose transaminase